MAGAAGLSTFSANLADTRPFFVTVAEVVVVVQGRCRMSVFRGEIRRPGRVSWGHRLRQKSNYLYSFFDDSHSHTFVL